jgi:S-formylglutathione hydrolase FrmB
MNRTFLPTAFACCIVGMACALHGADVRTFDVPSAAMGAPVKVSVVTPAAYGADGISRYPVVYLLHGAGNDHTTYLQPFLLDGVDKWRFIAVVPDGKLDWWMDSPVSPNVRRETFVVNELVPWVDAEFRTLPQRQRRAIAGHSMGGQGAMRLGMRHADVFGIVGNVMGGVDICSASARKDLVRLLGPYKGNEVRWRSFSVLAEAERLKPGALRLFSIVGTEDFFLKPNRDLHELLSKRHVAHEYTEVRGETDGMSKHTRPFAFWALGRLFERFAECFAEEVEAPLVLGRLVRAGSEEVVCSGEEASVSPLAVATSGTLQHGEPPSWRLLFQRLVDGRNVVMVRDLATGREETISPSEGQACHPAWGSDGSVLYTCGNETKTGFAARDDSTGWNLWVWKNGARRQVTHGRQRAYAASFAPDGQTVYFSCDHVTETGKAAGPAADPNAISRAGIAAVPLDGRGAQRTVCVLPQSNSACSQPRISPDGKLLLRAELAKFREPWRLVVSPLEHPERRTYLTSCYEAAYAPAWSPDGKLIAYTGFRDGDVGWGVYVMPSEGIVTQRIADGRNPSFTPDGKSIIYDRDGKVYRREVTR